ncbi:hypothetical protein H4582DRAFT_2063466 [Lactarius indigo]|nr:hypothetical protein H4582DRAFT_2063466 [Lactarius indigo]
MGEFCPHTLPTPHHLLHLLTLGLRLALALALTLASSRSTQLPLAAQGQVLPRNAPLMTIASHSGPLTQATADTPPSKRQKVDHHLTNAQNDTRCSACVTRPTEQAKQINVVAAQANIFAALLLKHYDQLTITQGETRQQMEIEFDTEIVHYPSFQGLHAAAAGRWHLRLLSGRALLDEQTHKNYTHKGDWKQHRGVKQSEAEWKSGTQHEGTDVDQERTSTTTYTIQEGDTTTRTKECV